MSDLYIYYRVAEAHAAQLATRVLAMQAALAATHGIEGQLKRRPEAVDGQQTWMEVYPGTVAGFGQALDAAVQQAALSEFIDGKRHTEVFTDLRPCA